MSGNWQTCNRTENTVFLVHDDKNTKTMSEAAFLNQFLELSHCGCMPSPSSKVVVYMHIFPYLYSDKFMYDFKCAKFDRIPPRCSCDIASTRMGFT